MPGLPDQNESLKNQVRTAVSIAYQIGNKEKIYPEYLDKITEHILDQVNIHGDPSYRIEMGEAQGAVVRVITRGPFSNGECIFALDTDFVNGDKKLGRRYAVLRNCVYKNWELVGLHPVSR